MAKTLHIKLHGCLGRAKQRVMSHFARTMPEMSRDELEALTTTLAQSLCSLLSSKQLDEWYGNLRRMESHILATKGQRVKPRPPRRDEQGHLITL